MKRLTILLITVFSLFIFAQSALCVTGNVSGYLGFRALDKGEWEPVETQLQFGTLFDITPDNWPVSIAVDLLVSVGVEEDEFVDGSRTGTAGFADITGSVIELDVGVRKIFNTGSGFTPYVGGGLAFASATYEIDYFSAATQDGDDSGVGIWIGAGFYLPLTNHFHLGFDARVSTVEVTLFNRDVDAGGLQLGFLVGYHW
jgi:opacity protein-like surface antigen